MTNTFDQDLADIRALKPEPAPARSERTPTPLLVHVTDGGAVYITNSHDFFKATTIIRVDGVSPHPEATARLLVAALDLLAILKDINNPNFKPPRKAIQETAVRAWALLARIEGEQS